MEKYTDEPELQLVEQEKPKTNEDRLRELYERLCLILEKVKERNKK
jgi:hypothetical protein